MSIIVYNIAGQQNALDEQEILYWIHLKGEILDFLIFKLILFFFFFFPQLFCGI